MILRTTQLQPSFDRQPHEIAVASPSNYIACPGDAGGKLSILLPSNHVKSPGTWFEGARFLS